MKRVSITDVARRAGVSIATASYALRGKGRVAEQTRDRVLKAAADLGFIRDENAARLRTGRSNLIGVLVEDINIPFVAELVSEIEATAYQHGFLTVIATAQNDLERQRKLIPQLISQGVAGMLLFPVVGTRATEFEVLRTYRVPFVVSVRNVEDYDGAYVGPDDYQAGYMAMYHLLEKGHRRVTMIGGWARRQGCRLRLQGAMDAAEEYGAEIVFDHVEGDYSTDIGYDAAGRLFETPGYPTAVLSYSDRIAIGVYQAAYEAGLTVGWDISVIGMGNTGQATMLQPALSTIEVFIRRMGRDSTLTLLEQLNVLEEDHTKEAITTKLVERDSVADLSLKG